MRNFFLSVFHYRSFISELITLLLLLIVLIAIGASETTLQLAGGILSELPLFGPWLSALSAFTRETLAQTVSSTFLLSLALVLRCLSSNILDSILIGAINAFLSQVLPLFSFLSGRPVGLLSAVFSTVIGLLILTPVKAAGALISAVSSALLGIVLMFVGFGLILGKLGGRTSARRHGAAFVYLFKVLLAAVETGGMVGLFSSALLLVPLVRAGVPFGGMLLWLLCLLALFAVCAGAMYAELQILRNKRFGIF